jgi:hypothetical protein
MFSFIFIKPDDSSNNSLDAVSNGFLFSSIFPPASVINLAELLNNI